MFGYKGKIVAGFMARTGRAFLFRSGYFVHVCAGSEVGRMGKVDRRVRRTRESLHKALISLTLEKSYDSITVQEVLDRADVGRSTFYTHFQSMDELLISDTQELRRTLNAALENQRKSASVTRTGSRSAVPCSTMPMDTAMSTSLS
jgi:hypothetical protein